MKKVAKKNLKLDKEVIASLSENEMVKVTGGGKSEVLPALSRNNDCPVPFSKQADCPTFYTKQAACPTVSQGCPVSVDCFPPSELISSECTKGDECYLPGTMDCELVNTTVCK